MSKLLSLPKTIINTIDGPLTTSAVRSSTLLIVGALFFSLLSSLLTPRIATLLTLSALITRLVPTLLVATSQTPNPELAKVIPGKRTAILPSASSTTQPPKPGSQGLAVLHIGIKVSHPLGLLAPGAKETGAHFQRLVKSLESNATQYGYLSGSTVTGHASPHESGHITLLAYFRSMHDLHAFAHSPLHREAWTWWNANVKNMPWIGVYHEAFDVPAGNWEGVYLQMPRLGLGRADGRVIMGEKSVEGEKVDEKWRDVLFDARKGVLRSSAGRMGRKEGVSRAYAGDEEVYGSD